MRRNSFQQLRELAGGGGMRGGCRECLCARQSRNTRNGESGNTACAVYLDQAEERKIFRVCRLSSKLGTRWLKGAKNQWVASPKVRDACAMNPLHPSVLSRGGPSHA
jgi:hypothetical protein